MALSSSSFGSSNNKVKLVLDKGLCNRAIKWDGKEAKSTRRCWEARNGV